MGKGNEEAFFKRRNLNGPQTSKKCSHPITIRKRQIKTTVGFYLIQQKSENICRQRCGRKSILVQMLMEIETDAIIMEDNMEITQIPENRLPYHSTIPLLGIDPNDLKSGYEYPHAYSSLVHIS